MCIWYISYPSTASFQQNSALGKVFWCPFPLTLIMLNFFFSCHAVSLLGRSYFHQIMLSSYINVHWRLTENTLERITSSKHICITTVSSGGPQRLSRSKKDGACYGSLDIQTIWLRFGGWKTCLVQFSS